MRLYFIGLSLFALVVFNVNAHDYSRVLMADTGRVGKELVRYLVDLPLPNRTPTPR